MSLTNSPPKTGTDTKINQTADRPPGSLRFDGMFAALSLWLLVGLYADGAAHHNIPGLVDSFFTPWHAVLYSGFLVLAGYLVFHFVRNVRKGHRWTHVLPRGYNLSLLGVPVFVLAGAGDMLWHAVFGFEESVEALISPTHLLLAFGGALLAVGPLRAAWVRGGSSTREGWRELLPALIALLSLFSQITFFTEYVNTLSSPHLFVEAAGEDGYVAFLELVRGIAGVLLPVAILMSVLLLAAKRWRLPFGSLVFLIFGNAALMSVFHYSEVSRYPQALLAVLFAALLIDLLYRSLKTFPESELSLRIFAFLAPLILYGVAFTTLILTAGTSWTVHVWPGVIFQAGIVGLLVSYLVFPPRTPHAATHSPVA